MAKRTWLLTAAVAVSTALAAADVVAQPTFTDRYFTFFVQQSFPKQTNTNKQIDQINAMFGTDFDTWDDVANLNVAAQLHWRVSRHFKLGAELDFSRGAIEGSATIPTEAGDARLKFRQAYSIYTALLAVAHFLPCPDCTKVVPFMQGAVGVAYEKDKTTLSLRNDYIDQWLTVRNDGYFPTYSAGFGLDAYIFGQSNAYLELGATYTWARLKHHVPAEGPLAPAPEVLADTDSTGPNYWVGIGVRF